MKKDLEIYRLLHFSHFDKCQNQTDCYRNFISW